VFLLSVLSAEVAIIADSRLGIPDAVTSDMRMRVRHRLCGVDTVRSRVKSIALLAIDTETQSRFGRYGAGQWLARRPFFNQLAFLEEAGMRPSVLGYDIILEGTQGSLEYTDVHAGVSPEAIQEIVTRLALLSRKEIQVLPPAVLDDINRLSIEQGNTFLTHRFAAVAEQGTYRVLLGFNLRGGAGDLQAAMPGWKDEDIFGDSKTGDEDAGYRIPYLKDMAIPSEDIHFASKTEARAYKYHRNANLPTAELLDYSMLGFLNVPPDEDSVVRRIPLVLGFRYYNRLTRQEKTVFVPSFALTACLLHLGMEFPLPLHAVEVIFGREIVIHSPENGDFHIPIDANGWMYLNFSAEFDDFDAITFAELAPPRLRTPLAEKQRLATRYRRAIEGRIVVTGVTATGVDVGATPLHSSIPMVFVQMTAISNILGRNCICPLNSQGRKLLLCVLFIVFTGMCMYERTSRLGPDSLLFGLLYLCAAYASVHASWCVLPVISPLLYLALCSFSVLSHRFLTEERAKRRIRSMFSTMVSEKVLTFLEEHPESFSLRGHTVEASVFFSDVADFTTMSEQLPPERITDLLNAYLTPTTNCIMKYGGYLDKYVGDSIMAVWGAPYRDADHALKACRAALEQQKLIAELNPELQRRYGTDIRVRMSVNSGLVIAGNMGSERKLQYTVMGDVVNLASRLEPANRDFGTSILIGEATYQGAAADVVARPIARMVVVGKKEIVQVYELIGERGQVEPEKLEVVELYKTALSRFHERDWQACLDSIDRILSRTEDVPSLHLRERARFCMAHPPGEDWQGEYVRTGKG